MSRLHVNHLKAKLTELYSDKIDIADARSDEEKENFFLTRAYAAYTLQILAQLTHYQRHLQLLMDLMTMVLMPFISTKGTKSFGWCNLNG